VSFPYGYDPFDDDAKTLLGISPQLMLMPNGVMVLRSGRPDNWVAISTNGQGTGWVGQLTYRNCPSDGYRFHGSTGNGGIAYRSANRMIVVGDNCELTWACNKTAETDFTVDKQNRIWRRFADVLTPDVGRIDLATKYRQGTVTVSGNMADTVAGHPRARVDGAFDGSTEYWSSAVHVGGPGSYVLKLDRTYPLTKVGLSLRNGRVATGRVYTSMDGITWSSAPVASAVNRTHLAMEYFTFTAPVPARYVKVEVDASPRCEAGLGSSCAFLNELELYSTIDSFENDPAGNRPRGFRNLVLSWVSQAESAGNDSAWALRVVDNDPNQQARASWIGAASATKTLEFRVKPTALAHSFLFDVLGRTSAGDQVAAYHFAATSAGVLRWYDGSAWHNLTGAGVVRVGTWQTIRVTATLTSASVSVNGTTVASGIARSRVAASLVGYTFASDGTTSTGDDVYFDDVLFSS
jgi:hypothetical protein